MKSINYFLNKFRLYLRTLLNDGKIREKKREREKKSMKEKKGTIGRQFYIRGIHTCSSNHLNSSHAFPECGHCPKGGEPELLVVIPK